MNLECMLLFSAMRYNINRDFEEARNRWESERAEILQMMSGGRDEKAFSEKKNSFVRSDSPSSKLYQDRGYDSELGQSGDGFRRENQILRSIKANLENEVMLSLNKEKFLQNNLEMITNDRNEYKVLECFTGLLN